MTGEQLAVALGGGSGNVLVMDRIQDPGNIGTMIRTAEAAGYSAVVLVKGTGDVYSPKVVRAAAGSVLRMPFVFAEDAGKACEILKDAGKKLIGTSVRRARPFNEVDMRKNTALIIGNEGGGMSEEFHRLTDENVMIPMKGEIESLNAAVAAGIIMYHSSI